MSTAKNINIDMEHVVDAQSKHDAEYKITKMLRELDSLEYDILVKKIPMIRILDRLSKEMEEKQKMEHKIEEIYKQFSDKME